MEGDWIDYYCREQLFVKVIEVAQKGNVDLKWKLYQGLGLILGGKSLEGISLLEPLLPHADFGLASAHLSLIAHRQCQPVDKEAVTRLEWKLEEASSAGERALQYAACAMLHTGMLALAQGYVDRLLRLSSSSVPGLVLSGWLQLSAGNHKAAAWAFKTAMNHDKANVDAVMGEVATLPSAEAISHLNQLVVRYPKVSAPLIEKMRLQLTTRDWSQALDTAARVLSLETNNVFALELRALYLTVVEGNYIEAALAVRRYGSEVDAQSGDLVTSAQLFCRICGCNPEILTETCRMAEKAVQREPQSAVALLELATQHRLAGRLADAAHLCRTATRLDATSTTALTALTAIQLAQSPTGPTQQILQQVEFLTEVVGPAPCPELLVLRAQCEGEGTGGGRSSRLLDEAVTQLRTAAARHSYGPEHLRQLHPSLLLTIASLYPQNPEGHTKRISVLSAVLDACPGLVVALLSLARAHLASGDCAAAVIMTKRLLSQIDSINTEAHLLLAEIHLAQEEYAEANNSLELGLSYNLQVREWPLYHVLLGAIQRYHGDLAACTQSMQTALSLNKVEGCVHPLSVSEMGTLYVELVAGLSASGNADKAACTLVEAGDALRGTEQEARLRVARADLATVRADYSAALTLLSAVPLDHPHYLQARKKMADIHLHKLKDSRAFTECYKQLVATKPSTENLILLGDAYMAIQEPELAVEVYEKAMRSSRSDTKLSVRLGRVLVRTHHYGKAIKCFKDAGQEGSLELAQLLMRLGQLEAAEGALEPLPLSQKALILAKVYEKSGDITGAMKVVKDAREELEASEVSLNAKMCAQLAEYASALREYDSAISYYKRALQYQPGDTHTEIALAKLYMQGNDWSGCQSVCSALLARDADNEPALLMLADLAYRRVDLPAASTHFSALLARRPDYWVALARLIEVKRRLAQLPDAKPFLQAATNIAAGEPGLSYCTGLYDWYVGNINSALHHFNCARGDSEWGQQALHNMVELCLAGDDGVATATRLLAQMTPNSADEENNVRLLQNMILLASKDKQDVELAMADLTTLASQETLRVGATLGLATGYVLQKQVARARNVLKRVAKAAWLVEEAEQLERCWLLLAELHVSSGKHEPAAELLRRVLAHNQSCYRAHQLLALIAEKDQRYLEAGEQYQQAWKLSGESDLALGFKLAFNQVKAKQYADAISTCHAVLSVNPDYPRIRKEILDKAVSHLRT